MKKYIYYGLFIIGIIVAIVLIQNNSTVDTNTAQDGEYTEFAQCLETNGALFYGAYWCSHCKDQKEMFGDAEKDLPYIECSLPGNQNSVTQECKDAGIEGYPTWVFADGSRGSGTQTFKYLSEKTGCVLPGEEVTVNANESTEEVDEVVVDEEIEDTTTEVTE